ncbi:hypothetical protein CANMA_000974 [Candida margitis]|uniref:uncharacterized protein n=1 Tax=Candida margitis TaxID=1775924 RepID=UPI0022267584|nr:uncharacterized protein CANMA_000974 [Candida margitis]KAI5969934.1 hypothetical protein CANMA_000974 [Candida margitis]
MSTNEPIVDKSDRIELEILQKMEVSPHLSNTGTVIENQSNFISSASQSPTKFNIPLPPHRHPQNTTRHGSQRDSPRKGLGSRTDNLNSRTDNLNSVDLFSNLPDLTHSTKRTSSSFKANSNDEEDVDSRYNVNYEGPITLDYLRYLYKKFTFLAQNNKESSEDQTVINDTPPTSSENEGTVLQPKLDDKLSETMNTSSPSENANHNGLNQDMNSVERIESTPVPELGKGLTQSVDIGQEKKPVSYLQKILLAQKAKAEKLKSGRDVVSSDEKGSTDVKQETLEPVSKLGNEIPARKKRKIIGVKPDFTVDLARQGESSSESPEKSNFVEDRSRDAETAAGDDPNNHRSSLANTKDIEIDHERQSDSAKAEDTNSNTDLAQDNIQQSIATSKSGDQEEISPVLNAGDAAVETFCTVDMEEQQAGDCRKEGNPMSNSKALRATEEKDESAPETTEKEASIFVPANEDESAPEREHSNNAVSETTERSDPLGSEQIITESSTFETTQVDKQLSPIDDNHSVANPKSTKELVVLSNTEKKHAEGSEDMKVDQVAYSNHAQVASIERSLTDVQVDVSESIEQRQEEGLTIALRDFKKADTNNEDNEVVLDNRIENETSEPEEEVNPVKNLQNEASNSLDGKSDAGATPTEGISQAEGIFSTLRNVSDARAIEIDTLGEIDLSEDEEEKPIEENSESSSKKNELNIDDVDFIIRNLLSRQQLESNSSEDTPQQHISNAPSSILQQIQSSSNEYLQNLMNTLKLYAFSRDSNKVDITDLILYLRQINFGGTGETMGDIERIFDIAQDNLPLELVIALENSVEQALSDLEAVDEGVLFLNDDQQSNQDVVGNGEERSGKNANCTRSENNDNSEENEEKKDEKSPSKDDDTDDSDDVDF